MIIVRHPRGEDWEQIQKLNSSQGDFRLTTFENPIIDRIVLVDDKIIAYGIVKHMSEAVMLVNSDAPKITRSKAMRELMNYAEMGAKRAGCEQLHCFVASESVAKILEKKFGFIRSKDIVLVKNL